MKALFFSYYRSAYTVIAELYKINYNRKERLIKIGEICDKYNSILNYRRLTFFSIPIRFHMCNIIDTVLKQVAKNKNH